MIMKGGLIGVDARLNTFVHAACAQLLRATSSQRSPAESPPPPQCAAVPHGLKEKTFVSYSKEWHRYVCFAAARRDKIPGAQVPWDELLLWQYLKLRAATCAPSTLTSIVAILSHFGAQNDFVLPTRKWDANPPGNAGLHRKIGRMKSQLTIDHRAKAAATGTSPEVQHCASLGYRTIECLLQSFAVTGENSFLRVPRPDRHHLVNSVMQYNCGMRFGHFIDRHYTIDSLVTDADGSSRLVTD